MSLAKAIVIGNLGRDPETGYTPSGTMNVKFSIAASRRFRDSQGQDQERTTWFNVTCWGKLAETVDGLAQRGFIGKGRQVYVEGRLESREYQGQDGQTRTSLDLNATEVQLLGNRGDSQSGDYAGGSDQGGYGGSNYGNNYGGNQQRSGSRADDDQSSMDDVPF